MNKSMVVSILQDLSAYRQQLPTNVCELADRLEQTVQAYSEQQFEMATDHAVAEPASEQAAQPHAPDTLVNELYTELNEYAQSIRQHAEHEELQSIVSRLRGQVSTYDRDFP
ncbi:hypothetical protein DUZ99_14645 [Xylanibacillus composti]|uniref:Uncharacterized protein n=1 Tax=Xylanibacillus composti TaxID=1572762 RepID=A0A8J4H293_9BACL|nr:hypothetical protein [Xylanibacillus composti]MDT9726217.1 hypothetical protein [Xylanibacillus composti]GIQ68067.1 hypothetical protein XYCOK13_08910 [Xylanibacillus composti]